MSDEQAINLLAMMAYIRGAARAAGIEDAGEPNTYGHLMVAIGQALADMGEEGHNGIVAKRSGL